MTSRLEPPSHEVDEASRGLWRSNNLATFGAQAANHFVRWSVRGRYLYFVVPGILGVPAALTNLRTIDHSTSTAHHTRSTNRNHSFTHFHDQTGLAALVSWEGIGLFSIVFNDAMKSACS